MGGKVSRGDRSVDPVRVETADGRAEYTRQQRNFAERAAVLRRRLIDACRLIG